MTAKTQSRSSVKPFRFESYGARVEITGNHQDMVDRGVDVARVALLGNIKELADGPVDQVLELNRDADGTHRIIQNGLEIASGDKPDIFFKFVDSMVRVAVGESSVDRVFLHAGVVGWKGKAIVIPADSFKGKSTLVAELVRNGAEYYSDEFAVFDADGLVHPFHRPVAMRTRDGKFVPYQLTVEDLDGRYGFEPIPAGIVLFSEYVARSRWRPQTMTAGQGVLELIQYALPMRQRSEFTFRVLNNIASRAIIVSSRRGTAETFAKTLLNFVDKHVN